MTYEEKPASERGIDSPELPASEGEAMLSEQTEPTAEAPVEAIAPEEVTAPEKATAPTVEEKPAETQSAEAFLPKKDRKKKKSYSISGAGIALLVVLCLTVSILSGAAVGFLTGGNGSYKPPVDGVETTLPQNENSTPSSTEPAVESTETAPLAGTVSGEPLPTDGFSEVAERAWRSVVVIRVTTEQGGGAGAGVIYDKNGYIVTNYHVVGDDAKTISVELSDGSVHEGTFIYGDDLADISIVKIDKTDCIPATFGDSSKMVIATPVFAIGNPLGKGLRITNGIITAPESEETIDNITMTLMNTNAAINSGNSGGGLFNMNGELVGIVNAKIGGTSVEGFGFAIPSSEILHCIKDLNEQGYITGRARLGVTVQESTIRYGSSWFFANTFTLCRIESIQENGSAAASGLQAGDILYAIDGTEISSFSVLQRILTKNKVGDTVTLTVKRPTIDLVSDGSNFQEFWNAAEEVSLTITFVEFKPMN